MQSGEFTLLLLCNATKKTKTKGGSMKDSIKNRKKKLLALCLSVMMLSSVTALAACKDTGNSTDSSSSSTTEEVKDDGLIKNAGFETFDEDNALNTSVTGWTKATTSITGSNALSSKAASGIIDLDKAAWHNLAGSNVDVSTLTEATAKAQWDDLTVKDKLDYYDSWKEQNSGKKINEKLDFYESMNIDSGDIPTLAHFDTHDGAAKANESLAEGAEKKDTKVLMIHNQYPETSSNNVYKALGTGQQYTSSSTVTVKAGSSAKFSVWVKTAELQSSATDGSIQDAVDKGAFISVTHSVGGKTMDVYKIENINTKGVTENNGWKQFSFYLKGSSYVDTTFNLVLGLGQGSMNYRGEYVNGYAFFDDIQCETITNDEYDRLLLENAPDHSVTFADEGEDKIVDAYAGDKDVFALNFYGDFADLDVLSGATAKLTETDGYTSGKQDNPAPWLSGGKNTDKDVAKVFANATDMKNGVGVTDEAQKAELAKLYDKYFKEDAAFANEQTLLLMSANGAAYTATTTNEIGFTSSDYLAISFFVKTSNVAEYVGAGVTLVDGKNKTAFASVDTSDMEAIKVNDEKLYGDWQRYLFFVENTSESSATTFTLEFTYGATSIEVDKQADSYYAGFAAFTGFEIRSMDKAEYKSAQSNSNAKLVSVNGDKPEEVSEGTSFDSALATPTTALKEGLATPQKYLGVTFDSAYLGGSNTQQPNENANAGLISKKYFTEVDGYFDTAAGTAGYAWLDGVKAATTETTADKVWNAVFGNSTQPLLMYNAADERANAAYGFIGTSTTLAANTYTAVSVRVRGTGKAYIRLVDTDASNYAEFTAYNETLSVGGYLTFWYNDDGNVCTGDPEDKATQVAFKLQTNGLYKANKRGWDGYEALADKDAWYANLSAYTEKDENGNLLVAKGGAKHDYNDHWNNAGMNGIAFYYNKDNGGYYADEGLKVPVIDLASVAGLTHRTEATSAEGYALEAEITAVKEDWTTVTFYVHTGDKAKSYRLEVWNGGKDGKGNDAGSYLVVDANNPGAAESNFTSLLEEYKDEVSAENKFESVFSYFDTASFLRYNKELDENKLGNLYEDNYTPSAQESGIAYLKYEESKYVTVFVDYQYSEKTVAASEVEEDVEEEETEDTDPETNVWLLASSLAIAGVLILAIVSILIRKVFLKGRKKSVKKQKNNKD